MAKYLLSTGKSTDSIEYYVIDLFKLYMNIFPREIPGMDSLGFNFIMTDIKKPDLLDEITIRITDLIKTISDRFKSGIKIDLVSVELIRDDLAKIEISVNNIVSEEIELNIYK